MEASTLGRGSFRERCSIGSWFSMFMFQDVPGTVPDCTRNFGFRRNSSSLDRASRIRLSVLVNPYFFVTLLSISSDNWVIYTSFILGTAEFRNWLFPGDLSRLSPATAAKFLLLLKVAIFKGKLLNCVEDGIRFY